jgi:hypothetical protein
MLWERYSASLVAVPLRAARFGSNSSEWTVPLLFEVVSDDGFKVQLWK